MADEKPVKLCGVCKTGKLIPSACGCDNAACHNYVEKWKPCTTGYARPKEVELPKPVAPTAPAPAPAPVAIVPVSAEPEKKKRGRPKKNP